MAAYAELAAHFGRASALSNAIGILQWDNDTMMPKGAVGTRSESLALLRVLHHGLVTDPKVGDLLAAAEDRADAIKAADVNASAMSQEQRDAIVANQAAAVR
jgi:Zn-dependent M32 family carboxypeptidase